MLPEWVELFEKPLFFVFVYTHIYGGFNLKVGWNIACYFRIQVSVSQAVIDEDVFCGGNLRG